MFLSPNSYVLLLQLKVTELVRIRSPDGSDFSQKSVQALSYNDSHRSGIFKPCH